VGAKADAAVPVFIFRARWSITRWAAPIVRSRSLCKTAPKVATLVDGNGNEPRWRRTVSPACGCSSNRAAVPPGRRNHQGNTARTSRISPAKRRPRTRPSGDSVLAGTLNLWGVVEVTVLRRAQESALQKIIHLIKEAQHLKAPSQRLTDKFGTSYTYAILSLSLLMFFVWWLGLGYAPFISTAASKSAFLPAMTLLVVGRRARWCSRSLQPCWQRSPGPPNEAFSSARRSRLKKLAGINVVAMDKTGTLTTARNKGGARGKLSAWTRAGGRAIGLFVGAALDAPAGPRNHALWEATAVARAGAGAF